MICVVGDHVADLWFFEPEHEYCFSYATVACYKSYIDVDCS